MLEHWSDVDSASLRGYDGSSREGSEAIDFKGKAGCMKCSCSAHGSFLTAKGLEEAAQRREYSSETVDMFESSMYLDKIGSVSGSGLDGLRWPSDAIIEEQYRRFLNGS